jgi:hypothetical protein
MGDVNYKLNACQLEIVVLPVRLVATKDANEPLIRPALQHLANAPGLRTAFGLPCFVGCVGHMLTADNSALLSSYKSIISALTSAIAASITSIRVKVRQLPMR